MALAPLIISFLLYFTHSTCILQHLIFTVKTRPLAEDPDDGTDLVSSDPVLLPVNGASFRPLSARDKRMFFNASMVIILHAPEALIHWLYFHHY